MTDFRRYAGKDATEEYEVSWTASQPGIFTDLSQFTLPMRSRRTWVCAFLKDASLPPLCLTPDPSKHLGALIPNTLPKVEAESPAPPPASIQVPRKASSGSGDPEPEEFIKPDIEEVLSLHDFEAIARR